MGIARWVDVTWISDMGNIHETSYILETNEEVSLIFELRFVSLFSQTEKMKHRKAVRSKIITKPEFCVSSGLILAFPKGISQFVTLTSSDLQMGHAANTQSIRSRNYQKSHFCSS